MKATYTEEQRQAYMKDTARSAIDSILDMVKNGSIPDAIAHHIVDVAPDAPCRTWSAVNRMILYTNRTADARGYKQWAEVGRHVKKGAKAFHIFVPRFAPRPKDAQDEEEQAEPKLVGFMLAPVFRYEDTEGQPLPDYEPAPLPEFSEAATAWGIRIEYGPSTQGEYGYLTARGSEVIHLSSKDPDTLWHELGHAAHRRILQRQGKDLVGGQQVEQEIVAEWVAATIGRMFGRPAGETGFAIRYMEQYAGSREKLVGHLAKLAQIAEECVALIMDAAASIGSEAKSA